MNNLNRNDKIDRFIRGVSYILNYGLMVIDGKIKNPYLHNNNVDEITQMELDLEKSSEKLEEDLDENILDKINEEQLSKMKQNLGL